MNVLKPQNAIEKNILSDKEYMTAISIGRPRQGHKEGTIKIHIIQILEYIEQKYSKTKYYTNLRIIALLHDTGKFAFLKEVPVYMPEVSDKKCKKLLIASQKFKTKYYNTKNVSFELKKYMFTPIHAEASYQFSKKFIKDKELLKLIKYHDLGIDMALTYKDTKICDTKLFKKVFSNIDLNTYLAFVKCDANNRIDITSRWLKSELKNNNIKIPKLN